MNSIKAFNSLQIFFEQSTVLSKFKSLTFYY